MPRISRRKRKYNLFKRLFISSIYNRIAHEILFDDSSIGSQEEANINFFALNLLETINNRYSDRAPTYAPRSYAVLNATTDYSDSNFLLHFRMEKAAFTVHTIEYCFYHRAGNATSFHFIKALDLDNVIVLFLLQGFH